MGNGEFSIESTDNPRHEDLVEACRGLRDHCLSHTGPQPHHNLGVVLRTSDGTIVGGADAVNDAGWLDIGALFVQEQYRRRGLGSRILVKLEEEAVAHGCRHATLQTYKYQALDFYLRHGYEVFGQLEDYPGEHTRYFLKKELAAAAEGSTRSES